MADATQVLTAVRDMGSVKNLSPTEMHDLIRDGLMAALARRFGPNVEAEIQIDAVQGEEQTVTLTAPSWTLRQRLFNRPSPLGNPPAVSRRGR